MLYFPDGKTCVVDDAAEHDRLAKQGWRQEPLPIHQRPAVSQTPAAGASDPMGMLLRSVIESVLDERGLTKDFAARLVSRSASDPPEGEALDSPAAPFLPDKRSRHHG